MTKARFSAIAQLSILGILVVLAAVRSYVEQQRLREALGSLQQVRDDPQPSQQELEDNRRAGEELRRIVVPTETTPTPR